MNLEIIIHCITNAFCKLIELKHFLFKLFQAKGTSTYRQLMRTENKAKYEIYLQEQKQRMKEYRSRIKQDPKKLQEQREKAKVRQKKYRELKKEEG